MIQVKYVKVSELIPYANNARTHSDEQIAQIAASIKEFGWTNPILIDEDSSIIAGHGRLSAARKLDMEEVPAIQLTGLTKTQKKALILADNKLALNAGWDDALLKIELESLLSDGFDLSIAGFSKDEVVDIVFEQEDIIDDSESAYTKKIEPPIYEPKGENPLINQLYDRTKTKELIKEIDAADIPHEVKDFLFYAAERHTVFDFRNIAEFYAQAPPDVQDLMEQSALVIIDFDSAIEHGFVRLSEAVAAQYKKDHKNAR